MSLALVLVLVAAFGLMVPVLSHLGTTSGLSTAAARDQREDQQAARNAIEAAIAAARADRTVGRDSIATCPTLTPSARDNGGRTVEIRCRGFAGSGRVLAGPNTPAYALLTTGTDAEPGIVLEGEGTVRTGGPLWSNSSPRAITLRGGARLDSSTDLVGGRGDCPGVEAAPVLCGDGVDVPDPAAGDPGWASAVRQFADVPYRAVPADPCSSVPASRVVALVPGYYRDLDGLNRLTQGGCGEVVVWLQTGAYYFDLDFFDRDATTWEITDAVVVGGVPNGWNPAAATSQVGAVRTRLDGDGSCDRTRDGVELVFGGASRLDLDAPGALELCPIAARATREVGQTLALTGLTTGDPADETHDDPPGGGDASVSPGGTFSWPTTIDPGALADDDCAGDGACPPGRSIGGELAGRGARGTIDLTVPYRVPAGVRLDELTVHLVHRERGALDDLRLDVLGLPAGITCDADAIGVSGFGWRDDTATCTALPAPTNAAPGPDLTLRLTATNADGDGAISAIELDQVRVVARFTTPDLRAQSGCVTDPAPERRCPFVNVEDGAPVVVWGTVHAPLARITADFGGVPAFHLARGAVLRSFTGFGIPDDPAFTPFSLPVPPYADRFVAFEAWIDQPNGGPELALQARVHFCESLDPAGGWDERCRTQPPPPTEPPRTRTTTWTVAL
jgi:hypothetical protein